MAKVTVLKDRYTVDPLYQWDLNQVLQIYGLSLASIPEIHFTNVAMDRAIVRQATMDAAGVISVNVPNSLLQKPYKIRAYVCIYAGDAFKSLYLITIPVEARSQPNDYTIAANDEEVYSFNALENKIDNTLELVLARYDDVNAKYEDVNQKYNEALNIIEETVAETTTLKESAETSANNASASALSSADSATEALTSATNAFNRATEAANSATSASISASTSTVNAQEAETSANSARESAETAENAKNKALEYMDVTEDAMEEAQSTLEEIRTLKSTMDSESYKHEIALEAIDILKGQPILAVVDENNNIIVSGNLADGTYTLKFENEDGSYSDIGTVDVGTVATDLFTAYTPLLNQRYSQSSGAWTSQNGCVGFELPIADIAGKTMRFSGFLQTYANGGGSPSWYAVNDDNSQKQTFLNVFTSNIFTDEGNNTYSWVVPSVDGATKLMVFLPIANVSITETYFTNVSWILTD